MMRLFTVLAVMILFSASASAAVTIEEHVLQKGYFVQPGCNAKSSKENQTDIEEGWNECACEADIRYPQLTGLNNIEGQASLNADFKNAAEQAQCKGESAIKPKPPADPKNEISPSSLSHHYEVTFQTPHILGLEFTDWEYMGGAHGNGAVEGVVIDLDKAKILTIGDLIAPKDMPGVNDAIYKALSAKPEEEVFRDQVESRKGSFIKSDKCDGCTLTLTPAGVNIVFETYEVAPYSSGNTAVAIPAQFISYSPVVQALAQQGSAPIAEKK